MKICSLILRNAPIDIALDRTNLGNARLQGLPQDVLHGDPTGVLFDWANSAFYFSYVCVIPDTTQLEC